MAAKDLPEAQEISTASARVIEGIAAELELALQRDAFERDAPQVSLRLGELVTELAAEVQRLRAI